MKNLKDQRFNSIKTVSLLLLTLILTIPITAFATSYTYTSPTFNNFNGSFPSSPAIGDHLTIQFTYDSPLTGSTIDLSSTIPFTMTSGALTLSSQTALGPHGLYIYGVSASGLPSSWVIGINAFQAPGWVAGYGLISYHYGSGAFDEVEYTPIQPGWSNYSYYQGTPGAWTAVPEPGILILLGISMASVVGLRRWWKD